jgi:hypothetical protein
MMSGAGTARRATLVSRLAGPTVAVLTLAPGVASGQEIRGRAFLETRIFPSRPAYTDQRGAAGSPSYGLEPELLWEIGSGALRLRVRPFLRVDAHDADRTHQDIRELNALYLTDAWTLFVGVGRVFWGKTEAHHLVDIVNQTDLVEGLDGEEKLGQPMISVTLERSWGAIDLLFLPYFRERTFPDARGRLRGPLPILDDALYTSDAGRWHPDFALRWTYFTGELDFGLSLFRGTSREPALVPVPAEAGLALRPRYDVIDQISIDAQWTRGATLWKLEAMTRGGHGDRFVATVAGLEHTFFDAVPATDVGVLVEVMVDGRGDDAPFTAFDHDLFLGMRWAFHDAASTSIVGGPVIDYRTGEAFAFVEAERRIGNRYLVEVEARWLFRTVEDGSMHGLRRDDVLTLSVSRYF